MVFKDPPRSSIYLVSFFSQNHASLSWFQYHFMCFPWHSRTVQLSCFCPFFFLSPFFCFCFVSYFFNRPNTSLRYKAPFRYNFTFKWGTLSSSFGFKKKCHNVGRILKSGILKENNYLKLKCVKMDSECI